MFLIGGHDGGRQHAWAQRLRERGSGARRHRGLDQAPAAVDARAPRPRLDAEAEETRRLGRIAAILFGFGALASIPSSLLLEPRPPLGVYTLTVVGTCSALACWLIPWERMGRDWLNVIALVGTVEMAATMAVADTSYGVFAFFVAIFVGYAIRSHAALLGHFTLMTIVLLAPVVYDPETARDTVRQALLFVPGIAIAGGTVAFLRERMEAKQRMYRTFAEEAFELVARIRGKPVGSPMSLRTADPRAVSIFAAAAAAPPMETGHLTALQELDEISKLGKEIGLGQPRKHRPVFRPITLGALLAALPLLGLFGIAHAGVSLPGPARAPFEALGISLPNQTDGADHPGPGAEPAAVEADQPPSGTGAEDNTSLDAGTGSTSTGGSQGDAQHAIWPAAGVAGPSDGHDGNIGNPWPGGGATTPAEQPPIGKLPTQPPPVIRPPTRPPPSSTPPTEPPPVKTSPPPGQEPGSTPPGKQRDGEDVAAAPPDTGPGSG